MKLRTYLLFALLAFYSYCYAVVIQGELTPGTYPNFAVNSSGQLLTSSGPTTGTVVDRSGTITTGNTAQVLAAARPTRKYLLIQNISVGNLYINFTTTAVASQPSILLLPNASFVMETNFVSTEAVSIIGATTGQAFVAKEF